MLLSEKIAELEAELEEFRSGSKFTELEKENDSLKLQNEDLEDELNKESDNLDTAKDLGEGLDEISSDIDTLADDMSDILYKLKRLI